MRNDSTRALVERVNAAQEEPFRWQIDISGLDIDYSIKTLITRCYEAKQPFALAMDEADEIVYFFPSYGCAVWCGYSGVTLNTFQNNQQLQDCIKLALVAYQKFIPVRQLEGEERYNEICEQLKRVQ